MFEKAFIVYDCYGDLIAEDIETETEAKRIATEVNGYYEEQY